MDYLQDIILPVLIGISTGIISGKMVTSYYRNKDLERNRVEFFIRLREYFSFLSKCSLELCETEDSYKDIKYILRRLDYNKKPVAFSWYKFNDFEKEILKNSNEIEDEIFSSISIIKKNNEEKEAIQNNLYENSPDYIENIKILDDLTLEMHQARMDLDHNIKKIKFIYDDIRELLKNIEDN